MNDHTGADSISNTAGRFHHLAAMWRWLIEPSADVVGMARRLQARLLMAMLLVLFLLGLLSLILANVGLYDAPGQQKTVGSVFDGVTLLTLCIFAVAYALARSRHHAWGALITVTSVWAATFAAVILQPKDPHPIFFLIIGGLIASLFLSPRVTALIFVVTFISILLLPSFDKSFSLTANTSVLFFTLMVGGLIVMAASLRQRYLTEMDSQTQQLMQNAARLRELAIRDPLTGLFNRRYLQEVLTNEMIRANRKGSPIGIIMADIDHFKGFNDRHGHAAGDEVLIQVSNLLRNHVRSSDLPCRYGGEEFLLILPEAPQEITKLRAEQIGEDVHDLHIEFEGKILEGVTLSLGVASFPQDGATYDALLGAADDALYRAKAEGRDRVVIADSLH